VKAASNQPVPGTGRAPAGRTAKKLGYEVGDGERILATAITEQSTLTADGEFEALVEGSTKPVAQTRTNAGIVKVKRYAFDIPLEVRRFFVQRTKTKWGSCNLRRLRHDRWLHDPLWTAHDRPAARRTYRRERS
jgi:hypothetical protein